MLQESKVTHLFFEMLNVGRRYRRKAHQGERLHWLSDDNHARNRLILYDDKCWFIPKEHSYNKIWGARWGIVPSLTAVPPGLFRRQDEYRVVQNSGELGPWRKRAFAGPLVSFDTYWRWLGTLQQEGGVEGGGGELQVPRCWRARLRAWADANRAAK